MIRRLAAGVALVTGLALSLTGCLGLDGDKVDQAGENIKLTAAQVLGRTAQKTGQIDTVQADLSVRMSGGQEGDVSMSGAMQYRTKPDLAYRMTFDQMSMAGQNMSGIEVILIDRVMYMKMPALAQLGGGSAKPWLKISLDEIGKQTGVNVDDLLKQSQQMDPVQTTKMLTASKDAREVGKETVNGVETTHYTGTYRMEDAIATLPPDQQKAYRDAIGRAGQAGMGDMTFDLWVDGRQLPRQLTMKGQEGAAGNMTMTMKFRDYGKPVQISAPPAGETADFADLLGQMPGMPRS